MDRGGDHPVCPDCDSRHMELDPVSDWREDRNIILWSIFTGGLIWLAAGAAIYAIYCLTGCSISRSVIEIDVKHTEAGVMEESDNVRVTVEIGARTVTQTPRLIR